MFIYLKIYYLSLSIFHSKKTSGELMKIAFEGIMDILGEDIKIDFNLNKKEEQGSADITWRMPSLPVARYIKLDSAVKVV